MSLALCKQKDRVSQVVPAALMTPSPTLSNE